MIIESNPPIYWTLISTFGVSPDVANFTANAPEPIRDNLFGWVARHPETALLDVQEFARVMLKDYMAGNLDDARLKRLMAEQKSRKRYEKIAGSDYTPEQLESLERVVLEAVEEEYEKAVEYLANAHAAETWSMLNEDEQDNEIVKVAEFGDWLAMDGQLVWHEPIDTTGRAEPGTWDDVKIPNRYKQFDEGEVPTDEIELSMDHIIDRISMIINDITGPLREAKFCAGNLRSVGRAFDESGLLRTCMNDYWVKKGLQRKLQCDSQDSSLPKMIYWSVSGTVYYYKRNKQP